MASVDPQAKAAAEDEWSGSIEDLFEPLPEPTPEQVQATAAIRKRSADAERYLEVLSSRKHSDLAALLRERDLPYKVRRHIADILDPERRWQPPRSLHEALRLAAYAKQPERVLERLGYPDKMRTKVLAEVRAVRLAYECQRLCDQGLSLRKAISALCERLGKDDERTVWRHVKQGMKSVLFDGHLRQSNARPLEDVADWPARSARVASRHLTRLWSPSPWNEAGRR